MKDFRQLVRWAVPGTVCLAFGVLLYAAPTPDRWDAMLDWLRGSPTQVSVNLIGVVVGGLAVVTALGFVLSTIHHLLQNRVYGRRMCADMRQTLEVSTLRIHDYEGRKVEPFDLTITGAWTVVNVAWHASKGAADSSVAAAEGRSQSMYDIMHGAGATMIGLVAASIVGFFWFGVLGIWWLAFVVVPLAIAVSALNLHVIAKRTEAVTGGLFIVAMLNDGVDAVWVDERLTRDRKRKRKQIGQFTPQQTQSAETELTTPAIASAESDGGGLDRSRIIVPLIAALGGALIPTVVSIAFWRSAEKLATGYNLVDECWEVLSLQEAFIVTGDGAADVVLSNARDLPVGAESGKQPYLERATIIMIADQHAWAPPCDNTYLYRTEGGTRLWIVRDRVLTPNVASSWDYHAPNPKNLDPHPGLLTSYGQWRLVAWLDKVAIAWEKGALTEDHLDLMHRPLMSFCGERRRLHLGRHVRPETIRFLEWFEEHRSTLRPRDVGDGTATN